MGEPKKSIKKYGTPRRKWDKARLAREIKLMETYGLKNKRELRRAETILRNKRQNARELLALPLEKRARREKELLDSLATRGLLKEKSSLDDVLSLSLEELLERRLQTIAWRKNLAKTIKQARQFIVHGHIAVNGVKLSCPGYLVKADETDKINYSKTPLQLEPKKKKGERKKGEEEAAGKEKPEAVVEETEEGKEGKEEVGKKVEQKKEEGLGKAKVSKEEKREEVVKKEEEQKEVVAE